MQEQEPDKQPESNTESARVALTPASCWASSRKLYAPANSAEGMHFCQTFCDHCANKDDSPEGCQILTKALLFDVDHYEYPKEWIYNDHGKPTCSAFRNKP